MQIQCAQPNPKRYNSRALRGSCRNVELAFTAQTQRALRVKGCATWFERNVRTSITGLSRLQARTMFIDHERQLKPRPLFSMNEQLLRIIAWLGQDRATDNKTLQRHDQNATNTLARNETGSQRMTLS